MTLQDTINEEIVPTFAISTHFLIPIEGKENEWDVVTNRKDFKKLTDAFDLLMESLEDLGFEEQDILEMMYQYSSVVEGRIRDEVSDMLKEIEEERAKGE